jgi:hypothetical protein
MTLADLRRAAELLPPGSAVSIPREALLAALDDAPAPVAEQSPEAWLTADQVAERLRCSPRWVYDHGQQLGARHLSRRCVRFSSRAIDRYLSRKG